MGGWRGDGGVARQAQAGDGNAFAQLVEPYRRELQVYCYRFLGSVADAEDALQETLLSAWQGLAGFEGRASLCGPGCTGSPPAGAWMRCGQPAAARR